MINKLAEFFNNKSVLILGFGLEGRSTLKLLKSLPCSVTKIGIADMNPISDSENVTQEYQEYQIYSGENYLSAIDDFDIVMKAPGVVLLNKINEEQKAKITSQTDLLLRFSDNLIVGITGTKGKSTTSSLINHVLNYCNKKSALIGNIGIPPLDCLYGEETIIVCEMSCHQLEYVKTSPDIAVLLNIYEEHLDHYVDFEAYKSAKENIFKYQDENGLLLYDCDLKIDSTSEKMSCSIDKECDTYIDGNENEVYIQGITIPLSDIKTHLPGKHNLYNIAIATAVCLRLECPLDMILKAISEFKGLPHRLEFIGKVKGIEYINDSISTIPRAVISAIRAFPDTDSVIIGGMDRGINYDELVDFFNNPSSEDYEHKLKNIIALPDSGYRIVRQIKNDNLSVYLAKDLEDAVKYSATVTKIRCILSPASASYGFYKNFEERGEHFKSLVNGL